MIPSTLEMMEKLASDFPELWENAYQFQKLSDHTLLIHTGVRTPEGYLQPAVIRWSMFDYDSSYLTRVDTKEDRYGN